MMPPFKVRINDIEIVVEAIEDLDKILHRYGSPSEPNSQTGQVTGIKDAMNRDMALLRQFVLRDQEGISSSELANFFRTQGRGLPTALVAWCRRVGMLGAVQQYFQRNVHQGKRGYMLTAEGMMRAKEKIEE